MKAITHYFAYKHLKLILKEDCSIAEKKRMLRLLLRVYVPEQILVNKNTPYYKCQCGRFYNGKKCNECGYSGPPPGGLKPIEKKEPELSTEEFKPKNHGCIKQKEIYLSSSNHSSVTNILSGKHSLKEALEMGFEDTIAGRKCYFTHMVSFLIDMKHEEEKRLEVLYAILENRNTLTQSKQIHHQTILYQPISKAKNGSRLVVIIDTETGIVRSASSFSNHYMNRHWNI